MNSSLMNTPLQRMQTEVTNKFTLKRSLESKFSLNKRGKSYSNKFGPLSMEHTDSFATSDVSETRLEKYNPSQYIDGRSPSRAGEHDFELKLRGLDTNLDDHVKTITGKIEDPAFFPAPTTDHHRNIGETILQRIKSQIPSKRRSRLLNSKLSSHKSAE
mmetsp:Transcript_31749/g.48681  ORF Transcript_31749/g.48681 Transcript_31749/m.48681 type:complete len:159 (+) Transcript_31749:1863-2339(+)|eukprot:CAMPEP_0170493780 /NCGR_PEP_ID=MMETSP0208-20121228/14262_1 /TAXON_ID=197538 /ORGANISM="Strombidium inclinatum, Strain S3" /LENGTH=158 /DNA_ID=CAMNT_0010769741 /DNA_START=1863 /DNA_END=2339 /DNA_ORIENTATION=-